MNREIKFRAKAINNNFFKGEWVDGYYTKVLWSGNLVDVITDGAHEMPIQIDTLGQFTGVLDKNGKEIYEGDIVKRIVTNGVYYLEFIGEVTFDNGKFVIKHKTWKGEAVDDFSYSEEWNDGHAHGTILYKYEWKGNIYDNPNLIEEE